MEKKANETIVTFMLDESGSMDPVRDRTISGFNEYIGILKSDDTPTLLRLMPFNSMGIRTVYDFEEVESVPDMTADGYRPDSLTPLYDAIGQGIGDTDAYVDKADGSVDVIFTIVTDGLENDSSRYSRRRIFEMISDRQEKGWVFTFLGANQDSWEQGGRLGIRRGFTSNYDAGSPDEALRRTAYYNLGSKASLRRGIKPEKLSEKEGRKRAGHSRP